MTEKQKDFKRNWKRESGNQPGLMLDVTDVSALNLKRANTGQPDPDHTKAQETGRKKL